MGKRPFHSMARRAAHRMIVLTTVFALIVAPLVVILTHGPAAYAVAASMAADIAEADMAEEVAAQGHAHEDAGHDRPGGSFGGHNPADHDHQLQALICQTANAPKPLADKTHWAFSDVFRHLTVEGPRRPPRPV